MFFWKKKTETQKSKAEEKNEKVDSSKLIEEADNLAKTVDSASGDERIKLLNQLGSLYFQADRIDDAIKYYEISIEENKALGKAYTDLVKLYNIKRKQAVDEKDDEKVKFYLTKTDSLLQLSKDVLRGRI